MADRPVGIYELGASGFLASLAAGFATTTFFGSGAGTCGVMISFLSDFTTSSTDFTSSLISTLASTLASTFALTLGSG